MTRRSYAPALALFTLGTLSVAQEIPLDEDIGEIPETMTPEQTVAALERCVDYLVVGQNEDGSWANLGIESNWSSFAELETYYSWKLASSALAVWALSEVEPTPDVNAALEAGVEWLCTTRVPLRPGDWDTDFVWSGLCGIVTCVALAQDERFAEDPWRELVHARGLEFYELLEANQVPNGGWAYYDDPPFTRRPKWATSFCTAMVLPAIEDAIELGWCEDPAVLARAQEAVRRCQLPNGAYTYNVDSRSRFRGGESIDNIRGSLGRTQVGNWGLRATGDPQITDDRLREGLEAFFEHHKFLDAARMRPIPHEAYYANAAYFYLFAHHYAAEAIELLPEEEREEWHARLRPHLVKVQRRDGSVPDFLGTDKFTVATTAMTARAIALGLRGATEVGADD